MIGTLTGTSTPCQSKPVNEGTTMKAYSTFLKAVGLEPHYQMDEFHNQDTRCRGGFLPLCRHVVVVFLNPSQVSCLCAPMHARV